MKRFIVPIALCILCIALLHAKQYWRISKEGNRITWQLKKGETHHDHIEMSGKSVSVVLRYGVNAEGEFELNKSMVWPMLRTVPNNTHGSLMHRLDWNPLDAVTANGRALQEQVKCITLNGTLEAVSDLQLGGKSKMTLKRTFRTRTNWKDASLPETPTCAPLRFIMTRCFRRLILLMI